MKKTKEIKIYALDKNNIISTAAGLEVDLKSNLKTINMANTFFMMAFCEYKKLKDIDFTDSIIKVFIPDKYSDEILESGFSMNGFKYLAYTSTPSMQKKQENRQKTEFIFVKENCYGFCDWFEKLISLGKFKKEFVDNKKPIAINKKITSRTALAFSDVTRIKFSPRIIIVKNEEYQHLAMVDMIETEGKGKDRKIILDENNKPKLLLNQQQLINHELCDGMGLMSKRTAEAIKESMGLDYDIYFAVIRLFNGTATKGMCLTFDYVSYFEEYNKNCDGAYGCYTVKDYKGVHRDIRECDLLLTTSQCKWCENITIEEIDKRVSDIKRKSLHDLVSSLYVTKVNKSPNKLNTHTMSNYQLIGNLNIDLEQYKKLAKPTHDLYKGVLEGNMNYIKVFLKDFNDISTQVDESTGEVICEYDSNINPSTVTEALLNVSSDFYKSRRIKDALKKLVKQKINNLMSGRCLISGCYTYVAQDPIALLNSLINIKTDGELKENEFYCNNIADKEYVIQRCPCNCYNEIVKIKTTTNNVYEKYLAHVKREILILNAKDSTNTRMSTMDFDGDGVIMTDEQIIIDSVIESDTFFINQADGEVDEMIYNRENKLKALYGTGGNLIGKLALLGGTLSNLSYDNHKKYLEYLYTTLLLEQIAIDCPKTMIQVPEQMLDIIDGIEKMEEMKKPYYMRYRKAAQNKYVYDKKNYIQFKDAKSTLDLYAKYCIETLIDSKDDGDTSTSILLNKMAIPCVDSDKEVCDRLTKLFEEKEKALKDLLDEFLSNEVTGVLVAKKNNCYQLIEEYKENKKTKSIRLKTFKDQMEDDELKELSSQIEELKNNISKTYKKIIRIDKTLEPYCEIKKAKEDEIKANIQNKSLDLVCEFGEDKVVKGLSSKRSDGKNHTLSFIIDNFFDTVIKYLVVENAYKLEEVDDIKDSEFSFLGKHYKKVNRSLNDSHFVARSIVSKINSMNKVSGLGIRSGKESLKMLDENFNDRDYSILKNKTFKLKNKNGHIYLYNDEIEEFGYLCNKSIKNINLETVEEVKILDVEMPKKFTGKSIYVFILI